MEVKYGFYYSQSNRFCNAIRNKGHRCNNHTDYRSNRRRYGPKPDCKGAEESQGLRKAGVDESIITFARSLVYALVIAFAVIAALAKFGVQTASIVAIIGAAGFAVGFALQGSLANFAAGVMILLFRPFKVGDFINGAGVAGTVKEITLFNTILSTPDNVKVIVPNGKLSGDIIKNFSGYDIRRIDLTIGISYESSIKKAMEIIEQRLNEDPRVLQDPKPQVALAELADSSINIVVRPWVKRENYWELRSDLMFDIKERFEANGIEIPYPQQVVHLVKESAG